MRSAPSRATPSQSSKGLRAAGALHGELIIDENGVVGPCQRQTRNLHPFGLSGRRQLRQTNQKAAAAGFAQIFTTMLAKQMHESMVGEENGPMGIGGGASGDIYGALPRSGDGKALATSKSMSQAEQNDRPGAVRSAPPSKFDKGNFGTQPT